MKKSLSRFAQFLNFKFSQNVFHFCAGFLYNLAVFHILTLKALLYCIL